MEFYGILGSANCFAEIPTAIANGPREMASASNFEKYSTGKIIRISLQNRMHRQIANQKIRLGFKSPLAQRLFKSR